METWNRVCIEDYSLTAENGDTLILKRGKEYTTSRVHDDGVTVTVFTNFWVPVPLRLFAGERRFP